MSAAVLAQWSRDAAETVFGADFVTCKQQHRQRLHQEVTLQAIDLIKEKDFCNSVPAVTPFFGTGRQPNTESRPKRSDPFAIGANWRPLAAAYYRHHFTRLSCPAAGRGHGNRCPAGADLWATYEAATDAAHDTNTRRIST